MKITVISLDNWGYNEYILDELKTHDHLEVNHINFDKLRYQYPSVFHKIFNFFTKHLFNYNLKRNHLNGIIVNSIEKLGYQDKILVIKSDFLSIKTIKKLKQNTGQLIAFYNDNVRRCPRIKKVHHLFDTNYSFEKEDVRNYGFLFLTNFIYHNHLEEKPETNVNIEYEVFNISSIGKRNAIIENIALALDDVKCNYKIILVGNKDYIPKGSIEFRKNKLDIKDVNYFIAKSKTLLDVNRTSQWGLTFRVMDSLAFSKKLITTNPDLKNYDFYNPNNILIIDHNNIKIPLDFFNKTYEPIPQDIYEKYSINYWVKTVFELN